jgi:hypothetical protein
MSHRSSEVTIYAALLMAYGFIGAPVMAFGAVTRPWDERALLFAFLAVDCAIGAVAGVLLWQPSSEAHLAFLVWGVAPVLPF